MVPAFRTVFIALDVAAIARMFFVPYATQLAQNRLGHRAAVGNLLVAIGADIAALGFIPAVFGLERMLTAINDEMAVFPLGLSRILGITTHLGVPPLLPAYLMAGGGVLLLAGVLLRGLSRRCLSRLDRKPQPSV